jgi:sugar (pentulose or hexulose) kinase
MTTLLGIDLGTSSVKSLVWDVEQARIVAVASREYPFIKIPDRAEQNPQDCGRVTRRT